MNVAYEHTNRKGAKYFLHSKEITLRNQRVQTIYFFAKTVKNPFGLSRVPAGWMVSEQPNGLPVLKKSKKM